MEVGGDGAKTQNKKAQNYSRKSKVRQVLWWVYSWKVTGNQIVRPLKFHTPEIDSICLEGRPEPRAGEGGMGDCAFRIQVSQCDTWHYLEARGTPGE